MNLGYLTLTNHVRTSSFPMHPKSFAQKENILSLAFYGISTHYVASKLGIGKFTVSRTLKNLLPNHQTPATGHPSKLSATDQHAALTQIITGEAANAVQAIKHINNIISTPVSSETVRRVLRKNSFKAGEEEKAVAKCKTQESKVGYCPKVQEMNCGGVEESYLIR